jgi:hypothetical protein
VRNRASGIQKFVVELPVGSRRWTGPLPAKEWEELELFVTQLVLRAEKIVRYTFCPEPTILCDQYLHITDGFGRCFEYDDPSSTIAFEIFENAAER